MILSTCTVCDSEKSRFIRKINLKTRNQNSFEQCINILRDFVSRGIGSKILNERNSKQSLGGESKVYA